MSVVNKFVIDCCIDLCMLEVFVWKDIFRVYIKMWNNEYLLGNMVVFVFVKYLGFCMVEDCIEVGNLVV